MMIVRNRRADIQSFVVAGIRSDYDRKEGLTFRTEIRFININDTKWSIGDCFADELGIHIHARYDGEGVYQLFPWSAIFHVTYYTPPEATDEKR